MNGKKAMKQRVCTMLPTERCPVCQVLRGDPTETRSWVMLPCRHHMHAHCMHGLNLNLNCPTCGNAFNLDNIELCHSSSSTSKMIANEHQSFVRREQTQDELDTAFKFLDRQKYELGPNNIKELLRIIALRMPSLPENYTLPIRFDTIMGNLHDGSQAFCTQNHSKRNANSYLTQISDEIRGLQAKDPNDYSPDWVPTMSQRGGLKRSEPKSKAKTKAKTQTKAKAKRITTPRQAW